MAKIAVVTGAGAGVGGRPSRRSPGRATTSPCCRAIPTGLNSAAEALRRYGGRALAIPTDVADADAVEAAAERIETELGPIDVWVNVAMATVFAPVAQADRAEVERGTQGDLSRPGARHDVGAEAHADAQPRHHHQRRLGARPTAPCRCSRSTAAPSSRYAASPTRCAPRSSTTSSTSTSPWCDLPAVNTPQFDWAMNKMGRKAQPVPPIYQPEVPARAILFAATHHRREIWVGFPPSRRSSPTGSRRA